MANLNRIILVGRLTADPDARATVEGLPMTRFRLAVNRFKKDDAPQTADFIDIVAWRKLAEICGQFLKKGSLVLVEGRISVRSFEDKAGQRKWVTEVVARNMQMLGGGERQSVPAEESKTQAEDIPVPDDNFSDVTEDDDDLPF